MTVHDDVALWPAPRAHAPVVATVTVPGSKSMTNRALVLAALADGSSVVRRALRSRDTELMAAGLRALGVPLEDEATGWRVSGSGGPLHPVAGQVNVGNAGTVARFLPPLAALGDRPVRFDGDPRIRERPVGPLLQALRALGADIDDGGRGALPVTVHGRGRLAGGEVTVDASSSSQLVSGLLLVGPRCAEGLTVRHVGRPVPSAPHLAMTVAMLRDRGVEVDDSTANVWSVRPGRLRPGLIEVEPDLSGAAAFLAAAVVTGGRVSVPGWPRATTQPGAALLDLLGAMGARSSLDDTGLTLTGPEELHGLDADLHACGELAPVLAAVCALARTPSRLSGIAHLRRHETDRLAALARELGGLGAAVTERADGLEIEPGRLHGGRFATYDDHRLAMAAAVIGLVVDGIQVEDIATTGKTLPHFAAMWQAMLAGDPR